MNPAGRVPELLRQRELRRYWSAQTISMFGDQVSSVAIPYTGILIGAAFASEFFSGVGVMILDISIGSIFAAVIPDQLRSRVTGAFQAVNYGTRPAGSLVAGALGTIIGIRPTLWIAAIGGLTGFLWLLSSPLPGFRLPPENSPEAFSVKEEKSDIRGP
jgi:MFS family permease